ncbi:MAG TPA: hypothetical protein VK144_01020 [Bacillota bacterium]|nr:hypothetical protein [Bacillota bacterium]
MNNIAPKWYGEAAQSIAPIGIMMSVFLLVYTIWFGFAWGAIGWSFFILSVLLASLICAKSVKNMRHSKLFEKNESVEGKRIGKAMGILSGVSYGILWLFVILLFIFNLYIFIMPVVTLVIGLHFIPQAKIMNRKIDYYVAPLPIFTALIAIYLAIQTDVSLLSVYAIASIGGALATSIYGVYLLITYKTLAKEVGVDY